MTVVTGRRKDQSAKHWGLVKFEQRPFWTAEGGAGEGSLQKGEFIFRSSIRSVSHGAEFCLPRGFWKALRIYE